MKDIITIANSLVSLCREQRLVDALTELFDEHAVSLDPMNKDNRKLKGLDALIANEEAFLQRATIHEITVSDPVISGRIFSVRFFMDVTVNTNHRVKIDEIAIYEVRAGKIISQQFFIGDLT